MRYNFITGNDVRNVMQRACIDAYPDENSYMRIHINEIVSHSNRVTAAVALYNAGVSIEDIAFRLRWSPESVKFYLRETMIKADAMTLAAIRGAWML